MFEIGVVYRFIGDTAYVLALGILDQDTDPEAIMARYGNQARFEAWLTQTKNHWEQKLASFQFEVVIV